MATVTTRTGLRSRSDLTQAPVRVSVVGARRVTERDADDLEEQALLLLSRDELASALDAGQFKLLPWVSIVSLALRHPGTRQKLTE